MKAMVLNIVRGLLTVILLFEIRAFFFGDISAVIFSGTLIVWFLLMFPTFKNMSRINR